MIDAIEILARLAQEHSDGHFTVLKFTANWRVALETPDLDTGAGREQIQQWATGKTLDEAVQNLIAQLEKPNPHA